MFTTRSTPPNRSAAAANAAADRDFIADVDRYGERAIVADRSRDLARLLAIEVGDDDARSLIRQPFGDGAPDARRRAGDERDPAP